MFVNYRYKIITAVISALVFVVFIFVFFSPEAKAAERQTEEQQITDDANSAGFGVSAVLPENQVGPYSYFNLKMQQGQKQTVSVDIFSQSTQDHIIYVSLLNGQSNGNGEIEYGSADVDESLKHPFNELAQTAQTEILLPAGEMVTVDITITMPQEQVEGSILGGIHFLRKSDISEQQGTQINNDFAYLIGAVIFENEDVLSSNFEAAEAGAQVINYRPVFSFGMRNLQAIIEKEYSLKIELFKNGELYKSHENTNVSFAPNSRMNYLLPAEVTEFEAGEYNAVLTLTKTDGKQWNFDYFFNIDANEAAAQQATLPYSAAEPKTGGMQAWIFLAAAAGIALMGLITAIVILAVKKHCESKLRQQQLMKNIYKKQQRLTAGNLPNE